ncbi:MAG: hypothetical protein EPN43_06780, partial [Jatrophihabitans sp.]
MLFGTVTALAALTVMAPRASAAPGPPDAPEWWFDTWHVQQLWDSGARGQGIVIGEIDTGVNAALPALSGRILAGRDFGAEGGIGQVDRDSAPFGHGTAMASIMVGRPADFGITGLAPDARILPVAVPLVGTTDAAPNDRLGVAIRWAADNGAKIISMSLGGSRSPEQDSIPCSGDQQDAILYALSKGAIVLAAAGNDGDAGNPVEEPGVCLGVVAVGAADSSGTVASFSGRHSYVAFTAPGVNVPSLGRIPGQAFSGSGTSQATAIAAAATALVWSRYPSLSGPQVLARIFATLDGRRTTQDPAAGYGALDPYAAITATVPADATDPVTAEVAPFLARWRAFATQPPVPALSPAGRAGASTGTFVVGAPPG